MVIIMSGVSGVGKNTIIQKLIEQYDNMYFLGLQPLVQGVKARPSMTL